MAPTASSEARGSTPLRITSLCNVIAKLLQHYGLVRYVAGGNTITPSRRSLSCGPRRERVAASYVVRAASEVVASREAASVLFRVSSGGTRGISV